MTVPKKVFISRKESDREPVALVRKRLDTYAGSQIEFTSADDLPPGADWVSWIGDRLRESDMLLVFASDIAQGWEWVVYEAGWFTRFSWDDQPALVCFHATPCPPEPLKHFQCVAWRDEEAVQRFLKQLYGSSDLKGFEDSFNPTVANSPDELRQIARAISAALGDVPAAEQPLTQFHYNRFVELTYNPETEAGPALPSTATVTSDRQSLNIFGIDTETRPDGKAWTWADLVEQVHSGTAQPELPQWLKDLEVAVGKAVAGRALGPIAGLLQSVTNAHVYRPNVAKVEQYCDGTRTVRVLFIQQPTVPTFAAKADSMPDHARMPEDTLNLPVEQAQ